MRDPFNQFFDEFKKAQQKRQQRFILLIFGAIVIAGLLTWLAIDYNRSQDRQKRLEDACFQGHETACKMMGAK